MTRRRSGQLDFLEISSPSILKPGSASHPFRIHSPTHSIPGKPKHFNLEVLSAFGRLGNDIAGAFLRWNTRNPVETADGRIVGIRSFFTHAAKTYQASPNGMDHLTGMKWRGMANAWFSALKADADLEDGTKNSYLSTCRVFFAYLHRQGLVESFPWPSAIPHSNSESRPSITRAVPTTASEDEVSSWLEADQEDWLRLQSLLGKSAPESRLAFSDLVKGIVRRHAENEIRQAWHLFRETKRIVEENLSFDYDAYCEAYEKIVGGKLVRRRGWRNDLTSFPNLLVYLQRKYGGVMPCRENDGPFLNFIYNCHGKSSLTGRFHLEYRSFVPMLALVLLDRPKMNLSSPLNMNVSDLEQAVGNEQRAKWTKPRARYARLSDEMPTGSFDALRSNSSERIEAGRVMLMLSELSEPLRSVAVAGQERSLCLIRLTVNGRVAAWKPRQATVCRGWNKFRDRSAILSKLRFTLSQFRPTGALETYLLTGDIFQVCQELGHHSIRNTSRYIESLEGDAIDSMYARNVHDAFVAASAHAAGRSPQDFGLSEERRTEVLRNAHAAGLFGYNLSGSVEESDLKVSMVERLLSGTKFLVFEVPEVAAELLAFRQHILREGKSIQGTVRYEELWFPLLVACSTVIDSMSPKVVQDARYLLEQRPIQYGPIT